MTALPIVLGIKANPSSDSSSNGEGMRIPNAAGRAFIRTRDAMRWMVLLAMGLHFLSACSYQVQKNGGSEKGVPVTFLYVDAQAERVCLVGSFNRWSTERAYCMERNGARWSVTIMLPSGRHQYAFVVNGHIWKQDPDARFFEDDDFGMMNSVLIVE